MPHFLVAPIAQVKGLRQRALALGARLGEARAGQAPIEPAVVALGRVQRSHLRVAEQMGKG